MLDLNVLHAEEQARYAKCRDENEFVTTNYLGFMLPTGADAALVMSGRKLIAFIGGVSCDRAHPFAKMVRRYRSRLALYYKSLEKGEDLKIVGIWHDTNRDYPPIFIPYAFWFAGRPRHYILQIFDTDDLGNGKPNWFEMRSPEDFKLLHTVAEREYLKGRDWGEEFANYAPTGLIWLPQDAASELPIFVCRASTWPTEVFGRGFGKPPEERAA